MLTSGPQVLVAIDLGASSGRVVVGLVDGERVTMYEEHRFTTPTIEVDGHLRWNVYRLFDECLVGLTLVVKRFGTIDSIGIDTWGVDYALLDAAGELVDLPIAYRDGRTSTSVIEEVHAVTSPARLFSITGLQFLAFNSIYQLHADRRCLLADGRSRSEAARTALMLPDLLMYWLTGDLRSEATIASTTGLFDATTGDWSVELFADLAFPLDLFPAIERPGSIRGSIRPEVGIRIGLSRKVPVVSVASHDTASAVVASPLSADGAFVSSGTWSLVGLELAAPLLTGAARAANFSNERGIDGTTRLLRNVGGLWLLEESLRWWRSTGEAASRDELLTAAELLSAGGPIVGVDDPSFMAPGNVPERVSAAVDAQKASRNPDSGPNHAPSGRFGRGGGPVSVVRCVLDSLAFAYAATINEAEALVGRSIRQVHIVGGGSQNTLLCRLTEQATGRTVTRGPVEATALGNLAVQARALGLVDGSVQELRNWVQHVEVILDAGSSAN